VCLPAQRPADAAMRSTLVEGDKSTRTSEFGRPPSGRPTAPAAVACNEFASRSGIIFALDITSAFVQHSFAQQLQDRLLRSRMGGSSA
jgi:hypothetical protein